MKNVKWACICMGLVLTLLLVCIAGASYDDWVDVESNITAHAVAEDRCLLTANTWTNVAIGDSVENIIANTRSNAHAHDVYYMSLRSNTSIKVHTPSYEKTTAVVSRMEIRLPIAFDGEQRIVNRLDTYQNPTVEQNVECIVNIGDEKLVFRSMDAFPLAGNGENWTASDLSMVFNGQQMIDYLLDPTINPGIEANIGNEFDDIVRSHPDFDRFVFSYGSGFLDTIVSDGLTYTGSMDIETEISGGGD